MHLDHKEQIIVIYFYSLWTFDLIVIVRKLNVPLLAILFTKMAISQDHKKINMEK